MLVYYFVPFIVSNRYLPFRDSNGHNSVTVQNRTHVYMNFFDHKDLGNHLLQLCPKVVKHPVYIGWFMTAFVTADDVLGLCDQKNVMWTHVVFSTVTELRVSYNFRERTPVNRASKVTLRDPAPAGRWCQLGSLSLALQEFVLPIAQPASMVVTLV